ncbi:MAG: aminomethyltransferase family protein [Gammaproteobacteria bacterium]|nr:aminomethyltransferase family protein [Gammaproteobacteria bacterium]
MSDRPDPPAHYREPLLQTPFHARARALSQVDQFTPWSGYTTVDVFTTVEQEYFAIRNAAALYDLTPMSKYRIGGPDAVDFLDRLLTRRASGLAPGRLAYCLWCDDDGHLVDDGTLFRLDETEYRLCAASRQLDWLAASAIGFDVQIDEVTAQIAALALQGPTSCSVLKAAGLVGIEHLKPFQLGRYDCGWPLIVSRSGFTGDLGYELWMEPDHALGVWDRLHEVGRSRGLRAIGSKALNVARIEAGFIAPNIDFIPASHALRANRARSPLELGLERFVDFDKGHFTGRRALLAERERGPRRRLVGLDVGGNKPAHDALLYAERAGRREVGAVTSAVWSPTCKRNIALAMVNWPHCTEGSALWADIYLNRELVWERRMTAARVVDRVFFSPERRRRTPAVDA